MHQIYDVVFLLLGQLSETVSRRRTSSEGSTNDTTFTEMTPLSINENNGPDQQDVRRSDSCGIRQTGKLFLFLD